MTAESGNGLGGQFQLAAVTGPRETQRQIYERVTDDAATAVPTTRQFGGSIDTLATNSSGPGISIGVTAPMGAALETGSSSHPVGP